MYCTDALARVSGVFGGKRGQRSERGGGGERRVRNNPLSSPHRPLKSPLPEPLRPGSPDTQTTDTAQTQQAFCFQIASSSRSEGETPL